MSLEKKKDSEFKEINNYESCLDYLQSILNPITERFTKFYLSTIETDSEFIIPVEFCEPTYKQPVPKFKVKIFFKVAKNFNLSSSPIQFQVENELVYFPFFNSINTQYFNRLIDRVYYNKEKISEGLKLHTTFESTRLIDTNGEKLNLYRIEDEENLFSNNNSDHFNFSQKVEFMSLEYLYKLVNSLWKTLSHEHDEYIEYDNFKNIFLYTELKSYSNDHIRKLWNYSCSSSKKDNPTETEKEIILFKDFLVLAVDLIQNLKAYYIFLYKENNNRYIDDKINSSVEIMNNHFKEMDYEGNLEISYKDLKDCLSKENDLFTRKEIEKILLQINPNKKFEYWKFDKILKIVYKDNFDYEKLIKEDKIYRYLITIFSNQDKLKTGFLNYSQMRYALLIDEKLKLSKMQILIILNFLNIKENIDYYKDSILIRNIIFEIFDPEIAIQKIDILDEKYQKFNQFEDRYDENFKNIINVSKSKVYTLYI